MREAARAYFAGRCSRRFLLQWFALALSLLTLGIGLSARFYPGDYDWQYQTVSTLLSRERNPHGYFFFGAALAGCFSMLLPLPGYFRARLERGSPKLSRFAFYSLWVGWIAGITVGVERMSIRNLSTYFHKGHEYLALIAFLGCVLGVVAFWAARARQWIREKTHPPLPTALAFALVVAPLAGTASSQGYLYFVPNQLGWVGPHWRQLGIPLYLSLAFWEWLACGSVFVYLYALLLLTRGDLTTKKRSR